MELHPSQRRVSCELCRKAKAKCQRLQPDDLKCIRCTLNNACCDVGEQRKVGRPKRKDPASSSSGQTAQAVKRKRKSTKPASLLQTVIPSGQNDEDVPVQDRPGDHDEIQEFARTYLHKGEGSQFLPSLQPSASNSGPPDVDLELPVTGWLGWPSFMTDRWCNTVLPPATSGRILTDSESGSPPDTQPRYSMESSMNEPSHGTQYDLLFPNVIDQAIFQGSLAWIDPNLWGNPVPASNHNAVKKKDKRVLPFGICRQPAYYVHENKFSSDPRDIVPVNIGVDGSGAMARLIKIVYELRLRSTLVQLNKANMDLSILIHRHGPLFIGTYSLSEYVMTSAHELVSIVAILLNTPGWARSHDGQLPDYLLSTIVDVYCRLLSFFEVFLEKLTDGAERFPTNPVIPISGLTFNGTVLTEASTQGVLFSSSIYHVLGQLEQVLGLGPFSGQGLLSIDQVDALCNKLDISNDLAQSRGIMRPSDMRKLFAQVSTVLEQLSSNEP